MRVVIVVCKSRVQGHSAFAAEEFKASSTRLVRSMKSCTESCSGRLLKIGSALSDSFLQNRRYGVAERLAALVECRLDNLLEQLLVASQLLGFVAGHADDGALHLGRRIEHMFVYGEQVFHAVPGLNQYAQNAVGLVARTSRDAFGHFLLNHARAAGNQVLVVEHLEEYLAGNIVGIVAGQYKRLSVEKLPEVHFQEILLDDMVS